MAPPYCRWSPIAAVVVVLSVVCPLASAATCFTSEMTISAAGSYVYNCDAPIGIVIDIDNENPPDSASMVVIETLRPFSGLRIKSVSVAYDVVIIVSGVFGSTIDPAAVQLWSSVRRLTVVVNTTVAWNSIAPFVNASRAPTNGYNLTFTGNANFSLVGSSSTSGLLFERAPPAAQQNQITRPLPIFPVDLILQARSILSATFASVPGCALTASNDGMLCGLVHIAASSNATSLRFEATGAMVLLQRASCMVLNQTAIRNATILVLNSTLTVSGGALLRGGMDQLRGMGLANVSVIVIGGHVTFSNVGFAVYLSLPDTVFSALLEVSGVSIAVTATTVVVEAQSALLFAQARGAISAAVEAFSSDVLSSNVTVRDKSAWLFVGVERRRVDVTNVTASLGRSGALRSLSWVFVSNASHWLHTNSSNGTTVLTNVSWDIGDASTVSVTDASSGASADDAQTATIKGVSCAVRDASVVNLLRGSTWFTARSTVSAASQTIDAIRLTVMEQSSAVLSEASTWLQVYGAQKGSMVNDVVCLLVGHSSIRLSSNAVWLEHGMPGNGDGSTRNIDVELRKGCSVDVGDSSRWVSTSSRDCRSITASVGRGATLHLRGSSMWLGVTAKQPQQVVVTGALTVAEGAVLIVETSASLLYTTVAGTASAIFALGLTMHATGANVTIGFENEAWWVRSALAPTAVTFLGGSNVSITGTHVTARHTALTLLQGPSAVAVTVVGCDNRVSRNGIGTLPMVIWAWNWAGAAGSVTATAVDNTTCNTQRSHTTSHSLTAWPVSSTASPTAPGPSLEASSSLSSTASAPSSRTSSASGNRMLSLSASESEGVPTLTGTHGQSQTRTASTSCTPLAASKTTTATTTASHAASTSRSTSLSAMDVSRSDSTSLDASGSDPNVSSSTSRSPLRSTPTMTASTTATRTTSNVVCGTDAPTCTLVSLSGDDVCSSLRSDAPLLASSCFGLGPSTSEPQALQGNQQISSALPVHALLGTGRSAAAFAIRIRCVSTNDGEDDANATTVRPHASFLAHGPWGIHAAYLVREGTSSGTAAAAAQSLWVDATKLSLSPDVASWTAVVWPGANRSWFPSLNIHRPPTVQLVLHLECHDDAVGEVRRAVHVHVPIDGQPLSVATRVLTTATEGLQWASIVASPGAGSAVGRVAAVRRVMLCTPDGASDGGLLGLYIRRADGDGADAVAGYARGALVGNVVALVAALGALSLGALGLGIATRSEGDGRASCLSGALRLVLPSTLFPLWLIVLPATTGAMAYLTVVHPLPDVGVDLACLVVAIASLLLLPIGLLARLPHYIRSVWLLVPVPRPYSVGSDPTARRWWALDALVAAYKRSLWRHTKWQSSTDAKQADGTDHADRDAAISLQPARSARLVTLEYVALWYPLTDAMVLATSGFMGGASAEGTLSTCTGLAGGVLCLYASQLVLCIVVRPFTTQFALVHAAFTLLCSTGSVAFQLLYVAAGPGGPLWALEASAVCDLCVVGVTVARVLLVDLPDAVRGAWHIAQAASRQRRQRCALSPRSTDATSPLDGVDALNAGSNGSCGSSGSDGVGSDSDAFNAPMPPVVSDRYDGTTASRARGNNNNNNDNNNHDSVERTPSTSDGPTKRQHVNAASPRVGLAAQPTLSSLFSPSNNALGDDAFWDTSGRAVALQQRHEANNARAAQQPVLYLMEDDDYGLDDLLRRRV